MGCHRDQFCVLILYLLHVYTTPVADIIKTHKVDNHFYADDTQLYVTFKCDSLEDVYLVRTRVEHCVEDIDSWMIKNKLKLNDDKIELVVLSSKHQSRPASTSFQVVDETINHLPTVDNLGILLDQVLSYDDHISQSCKSSQFHLRNIGKIRKYFDEGSTEALVHGFVSSKLDYCNVLSFIWPIPKCLINRLQLIHNTAAHVVTCTRKYDRNNYML